MRPFTRVGKGIYSVLQTPFSDNGKVDFGSLEHLVKHAIASGVDGFLVPAVASEVECLSDGERDAILRCVSAAIDGRVALIVGASAETTEDCVRHARSGASYNADCCLVAVPARLYGDQRGVRGFFETISRQFDTPLIIQDLQFGGRGLDIRVIEGLWQSLPNLIGFKIETVPAGPKYTEVRRALGVEVFIAGGWAIPQMIEALDRGVDALIPESSMIRVYRTVYDLHATGRRDEAKELFQQLLPVLSFTNQELVTSIAFFKRLLVAKGIFKSETRRMPGFSWDEYSERIAFELIDRVQSLETGLKNPDRFP